MFGYDFEIIYKKGKQYMMEDVEALLCAILIIRPDWIVESREEWKNDPLVWTLIQQLQMDHSVSYTLVWKND